MKKSILAIAAAITLAAATVSVPVPAQARCFGCWVGAGLLGGFTAGAIIGSAAARPYYYGPAPVYYYDPPCYWTRERVWNGWGWEWHRVRVCR